MLLARYVEERYAGASPAAQRAFLELLEAPDPVIYAYCLGQALPPTSVMSSLIEQITSSGPG